MAKLAPKATSLKTRAYNKALTTTRKFNTSINALYNGMKTGRVTRTSKIAEGQLNRLTPSKDMRRYEKLGGNPSKVYNAAKGIKTGKKLRTK